MFVEKERGLRMTNSMPEAVIRDYAEEEIKVLEQQINYNKKQHTHNNQVTQTSFRQSTLKQSISFQGTTRSGNAFVSVTLRPAAINTGIVFRRTDLSPACAIPATLQSLTPDVLPISLMKKGIAIKAVGHLLSAFSGLGIDNVYVDVAGDELPIMDGSACQFVFLIESAGIMTQSALKHFIRIKEKVVLSKGSASAWMEPYEGFRVACEMYDKNSILKKYQVELSSQAYIKEIVRARCNAGDLEEHECRYPDEPLRHLILDLVGYLYTLGFQIIGSVKIQQAERGLHYPLMMRLLQQSQAWEHVTFQQGVYSRQATHPVLSAAAV